MSDRSPAVIRAGERKLVTILFADLSGYTALAERLDPEEVYSFLRPGMLDLQGIVESFGGSAPQIQGDGLMAVFGVPVAHEDDAERAVRAALACRDHVRSLNVGRSGLQFPEVHAGVNSGEVMVAPDATDGFAVVGDTVNTASRLGDLAEAGQILVDQTTKERTAAGIRYASQRRRRAKGKAEPLATYEALGISPPVVQAMPAQGFVDRTDVLARLGREFTLTEQEGRSRALVVAGERVSARRDWRRSSGARSLRIGSSSGGARRSATKGGCGPWPKWSAERSGSPPGEPGRGHRWTGSRAASAARTASAWRPSCEPSSARGIPPTPLGATATWCEPRDSCSRTLHAPGR